MSKQSLGLRTLGSVGLLALSCLGACNTGGAMSAGPTVTALSQGSNFSAPLDAVPDPAGTVVYFTATGSAGARGVFRVSASGGAVTEVRTGAPFVSPVGLVVSADGQRLFVADAQASGGGAVFALPVAGGDPTALTGTAGRAPRGLDLVRIDGVETLFFTGTSPDGGRPALLRIPAAGGTATVVASGAPLVVPDGVAVNAAGVAFVSDRGDGTQGSLLRIDAAGAVTTVLGSVRLGNPAGLALTQDENTLLASSLDPARGTSRVTLLDLRTMMVSVFDGTIGVNTASGGLHRALSAPRTMAWAGVTAGSGGLGVVYRVQF